MKVFIEVNILFSNDTHFIIFNPFNLLSSCQKFLRGLLKNGWNTEYGASKLHTIKLSYRFSTTLHYWSESVVIQKKYTLYRIIPTHLTRWMNDT